MAAFEAGDGRAIERALEGLPEAGELRAELDTFMKRHGHQSVAPMELSSSSWDQDVPSVLMLIANYLKAGDDAAPARVEDRAQKDREAATASSLGKLMFFQRPLLRYFLKKSQTWLPAREHTKSSLIRAMHRRRRVVLAIADRLVSAGRLSDRGDVFFLTSDELTKVARGSLMPDGARAGIARRRREHSKNGGVLLPENFTGVPKPLKAEPAALPEGRALPGIAVSSGVVTGKARVIRDPREGRIAPGEILVAPLTDTAWTPLFTVAGGLVVDIGGALSHGSTVAREYGLPAVVNVKSGTQLIKDGDTITVDGTRGVVVLH
jgi:pyruvate,water dikinase